MHINHKPLSDHEIQMSLFVKEKQTNNGYAAKILLLHVSLQAFNTRHDHFENITSHILYYARVNSSTNLIK